MNNVAGMLKTIAAIVFAWLLIKFGLDTYKDGE
jgi:hypothetical protein